MRGRARGKGTSAVRRVGGARRIRRSIVALMIVRIPTEYKLKCDGLEQVSLDN